MGRIFDKSRWNVSYEIIDEVAYDRYWWGRRPSTKRAFEEWLGDPARSQRSVEIELGKRYNSISLKMIDLIKLGIIRRFKRDS